MNFVNIRKLVIGTLWCLFLFTELLNSQIYKFKNFGVESNLPNPVIYTLNQDQNGYLWVGTANGLSRFDGFDFYNVPFPDSLTNRYPTVSYRDSNGILWFGCSDGTLFYTGEGVLKPVPVSNTYFISDIIGGSDGSVYIIPQRESVFKINPLSPGDVLTIPVASDQVMFSASFTQSGNLLIGTQENLLVCSMEGESLSIVETVEGFDYSSVIAIRQMQDNRFIVGTDGNGLFQLEISTDSVTLSRFAGYHELESLTVRSIYQDSENSIWISTFGSGMLKLQPSSDGKYIDNLKVIDNSSGLMGNNVTKVFQDIEGNHWIGLYGNGLSLLTSPAYTFYTPGRGTDPNNIIYINKFKNNYFLGTPSGFYLFNLDEGRAVTFTDLTGNVSKSEITSYHIDNENNIWVGTKGNGLFVRHSTGYMRQFYRSGDSGADYITHIEMDDRDIWLATLNGVIVIDRNKAGIKNNYNINNGLPHNSINQVQLTEDGIVYVATESDRLYRIHRDTGIISDNAAMGGNYLNKILAISRSREGTVWAATYGNGVFQCYADSVVPLTVADGLMSNFCNSIFSDSENQVWIGHPRGFSRYDPKEGVIKVFGTEFAQGGDCSGDGMYESPDGKIFIGTTEGLIVYDRLKDRKSLTAPANNINYVTINNIMYPYQSHYSLPYKKRYAISVSFVGINFNDPDKVYYSTWLENYDDDWTRLTTSREVSYSLRDGKYRFNMISVNEDGLTDENPLSFEIMIKKPVWRTWWFILSLSGLLTGIIILIVRERELEARTKVVMKQKAEIELQNMEITDSINYAKRIQSSILPDINRLREHFRDAFIIFHPRDIVSGDFYWFDKFGDDRFILVCADSTGHGVPGAFMSMIGSTLLRDIVIRQRISKPSEILTMLDKQIFSTLNQNLDIGVSNDGMDVVICEFSFKNRHLRFASAMRPVIMVLGGEPFYIKGNRSSVGGESVMEKYFDDQEYYLNEGDTIYLFSDGFPDQFGGPFGKKMKIGRLKALIEEVSVMPMDEQKEKISKYFFEWQGKHEQVDDVIFMGVRL